MKTKKNILIGLVIFLVIVVIFSLLYIIMNNGSNQLQLDKKAIYEDLMYYDNTYLGIIVKYPRNYMIYEQAYGSAQINCISIKYNDDSNAYVNIGYQSKQRSEEGCFNDIDGVNSEYIYNHNGKELKGDKIEYNKDEKSYISIMIKADNEVMNKKDNEYFGIQINYPKDQESLYMKGIDIILNNLVW